MGGEREKRARGLEKTVVGRLDWRSERFHGGREDGEGRMGGYVTV